MVYFYVFMAVVASFFTALSPQLGLATTESGATSRIISLGPINTENIYLLGAGDRLVGNTSYCSRPEAAKAVEKIGSVMQVSIEKIISLRPDLILATALTRPQQLDKLRSLGFKVVQFKQPASFAEICHQFARLGKLLGLENKARQIVDLARNEVAAIQQQVAGLEPQKVFLQVGSRPLFGAVTSSFTHDFIRLAGGINIMVDQSYGATNREKVIAFNPEVIIVAIMGTESGGVAAEQKKMWQNISVLKAARARRIHIVSPDLVCSPSPITFATTLAVMAKLIHPEIVKGG